MSPEAAEPPKPAKPLRAEPPPAALSQAMESARIAATRGSDSSGALEQLLKIMGQEQVAWLGLGLGLGLGLVRVRVRV